MENKKSIYTKLHKIQASIIALKKNASGHGYQYLNGEKLLDHIKPLMNDLNLLLKQEVLSIENVRQDYVLNSGKAKNEILSKVMMRFTWVDCETGETDENLFGANGQNDWDKGVGSALTYGERYFLLKYFHISTDEDDVDNPARKKDDQPPKQPAQPKAPASLPELTPEHDKWSAAVQAVAFGKYSKADVLKKYTISEANSAKFDEEVQANV